MTRSLRLRGPASAVRGTLRPPSDKSITHRALFLAGRARGVSRVVRPLDSADTRATRRLLEAFGVGVHEQGDGAEAWIVRGPPRRAAARVGIDCAASGTTARLGLGWLAGAGFEAWLDGDASLRRRPMGRVTRPLHALGARFEGGGAPDRLPLAILAATGSPPLRGGRVEVPVASAQVASALAFAALGASAPVEIVESGSPRDHTWRLLPRFGVSLSVGDGIVSVAPRPDGLEAASVDVPADPSAAAFWVVLASIADEAEVLLADVGWNPTRTGAFAVLRRMGASVAVSNRLEVHGEPRADLVARPATLRATLVAADEVPGLVDEVPILAVAAACAEGATRFFGLGELRAKESDRLAATAALVSAFGARCSVIGDGLVVEGPAKLRPARFDSRGDHRIAMAAAVLALRTEGESEILGWDGVAQSYPSFAEHLARLVGGERLSLSGR